MSSNESHQMVAVAVTNFIREELSYDGSKVLDENTDLIEQGVLDSMSLLRLVSFLEENCHVTVNDEDLVLGNFRSVSAIQSFVQHRLSNPNS